MTNEEWWKKGMEDAAAIARAHVGEAGRLRQQRGHKLCDEDQDARDAIANEEAGEDIAAEDIADKILERAEKGLEPSANA